MIVRNSSPVAPFLETVWRSHKRFLGRTDLLDRPTSIENLWGLRPAGLKTGATRYLKSPFVIFVPFVVDLFPTPANFSD